MLVILRKELREVLGNRMLVSSLASLPLTMVGVSLAVIATYVNADEATVQAMAHYYAPEAKGSGALAGLLDKTLRNSVGFFLAMPAFLPVLIASQSVAGEKERRTLEPLLATPVTALDVVLAKSLAAVIPAMIITLVSFVAFAIGADLLCAKALDRWPLPDAHFAFCLLVLAPLLSFFANCVSVTISARVGDLRLAQSLAGLTVMPIFSVLALQFAGLLTLGGWAYPAAAVLALIVDLGLLRLAVSMFDRDRLLTRWS
ncbi:MAG: ABC transporter permease subunit [Myxococcales bacterium]